MPRADRTDPVCDLLSIRLYVYGLPAAKLKEYRWLSIWCLVVWAPGAAFVPERQVQGSRAHLRDPPAVIQGAIAMKCLITCAFFVQGHRYCAHAPALFLVLISAVSFDYFVSECMFRCCGRKGGKKKAPVYCRCFLLNSLVDTDGTRTRDPRCVSMAITFARTPVGSNRSQVAPNLES